MVDPRRTPESLSRLALVARQDRGRVSDHLFEDQFRRTDQGGVTPDRTTDDARHPGGNIYGASRSLVDCRLEVIEEAVIEAPQHNNLWVEEVDQAPPSFSLLVKQFDDTPLPTFPTNWAERASRFGDGLTIIRSDQCPYIPDAVKIIVDTAGELDIPAQVVGLKNCQEAQERSPSAYGLFGVVYNGQLLSYHYLGQKDVLKLLKS